MNRVIKKTKISDIVKKLTFEEILFLLGVFAKQFYLLPSGNLQIGDILMLCAFFYHFAIKKKGVLTIRKDEVYLLIYFFFILIINTIYFFIYRDIGFIKAIFYYLFNIMILLIFISFLQEQNQNFLQYFRKTSQYGLFTQCLIFISGLGRWYASNRYEGTFNDPNQYGVFIFFSVLIIYTTGCMLKKDNWVWVTLGFLLILPSASTGMLVSFGTFLITYLIIKFYKTNKFKMILSFVFLFLIIIAFYGFSLGYLRLPEYIQDMSIYQRFIGKINNFFFSSNANSIIMEREWNRIIEYPEYLLYGAGEGYHVRFGSYLEIHSSILAPMFYYGVVPFSFFIGWCLSKMKNINNNYICVYVSLIVEAFFIVNTRQPMFWMILALSGSKLAKQK